MKVLAVKELVTGLKGHYGEHPSFDDELIRTIESHFERQSDDAILTSEQLNFFKGIYQKRWARVKDTQSDYTVEPANANLFWVLFSKRLASELNINFLQILIPTIQNEIDPFTFARLADCESVPVLFVGEDRKTLHIINGVMGQGLKNIGFSIYNNPKQIQRRSISLLELYRIYLKHDFPSFKSPPAPSTTSYWKYIKENWVPMWDKKGEIPPCLVHLLLSFIEDVLSREQPFVVYPDQNSPIAALSEALSTQTIKNVNFFYAQKIKVGGETYFLLELLLEALTQPKTHMIQKIQALALWVIQQNASLTSKRPELELIYREAGAGPYLKRTQFLSLFSDLKMRSSRAVVMQIQAIEALFLEQNRFNSLQIKRLFSTHWAEIKDTRRDYFRCQTGINLKWRLLAEYFVGYGQASSVYGLLIPTLSVFEEPITCEDLSFFPLNQYILSDNENELIFLENSVQRYKETRTFYNCNHHPAKPFTMRELERISHAPDQYKSYLRAIHSIPKDLPLHQSTVLELKSLVECSLYPKGLIYGQSYNGNEMEYAYEAYARFCESYHNFTEDERLRLNSQRILFNGREVFFDKVMQATQNGECIAVQGQYIAQLVMDYMPYTTFRPELEQRAHLDEMRTNSKRKFFRAYETVSEIEIMRKIQILYISLMTHCFKILPFTGAYIEFWEFGNTTTYLGQKIYDLLRWHVESGQMSRMKHLYGQLCHIVQENVADNGWFNYFYRSQDTMDWEQAVLKGTLKVSQLTPHQWHDPRWYFIKLTELSQAHPQHKHAIWDILDYFLVIHAQKQTIYVREIRHHTKIISWVDSLGGTLGALVRSNFLGIPPSAPEPYQYQFAIMAFIKDKLADVLKKRNESSPTLFKSVIVHPHLFPVLDAKLSDARLHEEMDVSDMVKDIFDAVTHSDRFDRQTKEALQEYITRLERPIYREDYRRLPRTESPGMVGTGEGS